VEREFGSTHCQEILGVKLDAPGGCEQYQKAGKMGLCRDIVAAVADAVSARLER
jgi:hypothetical protein